MYIALSSSERQFYPVEIKTSDMENAQLQRLAKSLPSVALYIGVILRFECNVDVYGRASPVCAA